MLLDDVTVDVSHLLHVQFTGQHNDIGKLRIKAQCLNIRDVQLRRKVNFHWKWEVASTILHDGHVTGDDGRNTGLAGRIDDVVHLRDVLAIDDSVHRQVRLHAMLTADGRNITEVVDGKCRRRPSTHVQFLDAEVDRVGTSLYGCHECVAATHGGHDFKVLELHCGCKGTKKTAENEIFPHFFVRSGKSSTFAADYGCKLMKQPFGKHIKDEQTP